MTNKYQRTIDRINSQKEAERAAIQRHIAAFSSLAPFIQDFNGKVINARFTNKIKEVTGRHFGLDQNIVLYYANGGLQTERGYIYADRYRSEEFKLVTYDNNRLDTEKTIVNLAAFLDNLKTKYELYEPNTEETLNYLTKMAELDKQIEELRKTTDYITRDISRNDFYNIKY